MSVLDSAMQMGKRRRRKRGRGKREYGMQMHVERDMFVFLSKRPCPSVAPYVGPSARTRCRLGPLSLTSRTSTTMYRNPEILVCLVFISKSRATRLYDPLCWSDGRLVRPSALAYFRRLHAIFALLLLPNYYLNRPLPTRMRLR